MQTAVVTGAGRGMGREIARRLAQRGYAVLVTDLNEQAAQETAQLIGAGAWAMAQDVRDAESHRAVAAAAGDKGELKVWVNNAGILRTGPAWSHPDDEVRLIVEANLLGVMWGSRAAADSLAEGSHIINMASMSSFGPVPGLAVYGATKHAVLGFTESLQGDLRTAGRDIRVHAVCPDTVDTGMMREHIDEPGYLLGFTAPKILTPEEVADAAVALIDSDRIVLAIPRRRMWLSLMTGAFPRFAYRIIPLFQAQAARKQKKVSSGR